MTQDIECTEMEFVVISIFFSFLYRMISLCFLVSFSYIAKTKSEISHNQSNYIVSTINGKQFFLFSHDFFSAKMDPTDWLHVTWRRNEIAKIYSRYIWDFHGATKSKQKKETLFRFLFLFKMKNIPFECDTRYCYYYYRSVEIWNENLDRIIDNMRYHLAMYIPYTLYHTIHVHLTILYLWHKSRRQ